MTSLGPSILSQSQRDILTSTIRTSKVVDKLQNALATGKDVNTALDNPQNFFAAQSLIDRSDDLERRLDGIGQSISTVQETDTGIESILKLLDLTEANIEDFLATSPEEELIEADVSGNVLPATVAAFSSYGGSQDQGGAFSLSVDGESFTLDGNLWKRSAINYNITANTVLRFDFRSTNLPEIASIGFDNDANPFNSGNRFFIAGEQTTGLAYSAPIGTFQYSGSGDFETIEIPIGDYFTGSFNDINFIHDDDGVDGEPDDGDATYANVIIYETDNNPFDPVWQIKGAEQLNKDYLKLIDQIDALAEDTNYRGTNLLKDDDLRTFFNENNSSFIDIEGINATSAGLKLSEGNFTRIAQLEEALVNIREAKQILRTYNASLQNDLAVITTRQDFTLTTINNLSKGADKLTVADQNKLGAELIASSTRQQLQTTALSLSAQSNSAILNIIG